MFFQLFIKPQRAQRSHKELKESSLPLSVLSAFYFVLFVVSFNHSKYNPYYNRLRLFLYLIAK